MFSEGLFQGSALADWGKITVKVDILETANVKQLYLDYCTARGGDLVARYAPDGFEPAIGRALSSQPVFFHQSDIGRTEFEFCTTSPEADPSAFRKPIFAITPVGRSSFYLLEGEALTRYVDNQLAMLTAFAEEAKRTLAYYTTNTASKIKGMTIAKASLLLYTSKPLLVAELKNDSLAEMIVPLANKVVLMADRRTYNLAPAYAGMDRYDIATQKGNCLLSKDRSALQIPVGEACNVIVALRAESDAQLFLSGVTRNDSIAVYFAGHTLPMLAKSEFDTGESAVWLKPRLARQR
jgi:hypothetical protein